MSLYAIADLHLSLFKEKPMDIFGKKWKNHCLKIKEYWEDTITEKDVIILAGDTSWAMTMEEVKPDLEFIHSLPGRKIVISGNHDYWWGSTSRLNNMYNDMFFLKNNCYNYEDYALCGTRGWICPNDSYFTAHDKKIYLRELNRLELSLKTAEKNRFNKIIVMLHFPPTNDKKECSGFIDLIKKYPVRKLVYGHLHGDDFFNLSYKGDINGIEYNLISADYLNFKPLKIL